MKPNWKDAPSWSNFVAQDENGDWWWYEYEPIIEDGNWDRSEGRYTKAFSSGGWKESLEARP